MRKKRKHKANLKALVEAEIRTNRNRKKALDKFYEEYRERQRDFPVTKSKKKRKPLTKEQYRKWLKSR